MALATVAADGMPAVRMVLLKGVDERGFAFYTNYRSAKAADLDANPRAALAFRWHGQGRQVRVAGAVERVATAESDHYFATRPRESQLGAWASPQSEVIAGRSALDDRLAEVEARFRGSEVPRPPHWGGYRVVPARIEFWQQGPARLHDRIRYLRTDDGWQLDRLAP